MADTAHKKNETHRFDVGEQGAGKRIDKMLSLLCPDLSRARIQALMEKGHVLLNNNKCTAPAQKLKDGDRIEIAIPPPEEALPEPEKLPLDIVYEDGHLLVIDKQAGLVVHPGAGNTEGTLVNALLHHCGDSLSGIGGVLRPGIVHRLDKDTSGLMVVAKSDKAHQGLSAQLSERTLKRLYKALVFGVPVPPVGMIDAPIGRHAVNRQDMTVTSRNGRAAKTHYRVEENYRGACALVECRLESGRTHQIRVHMNHIRHPLIGDPRYGPQKTALRAALKKADYAEDIVAEIMGFPRQALHAWALDFSHPVTNEQISLQSGLPEDFLKLLNLLK